MKLQSASGSILALALLAAGALPLMAGDPIPLVVGRASGPGVVRFYPDAAPSLPSFEEFTAFRSSFNSGVDLSNEDVDGDGTRDVVLFHGPFGAWPELRAVSGATGELIAADVIGGGTVTNPMTARYARLLGASSAVTVVGTGGSAPTLKVAGGATIPLPVAYFAGVNFAMARTTSPAKDFLVTVPRGSEATHFRVHELPAGTLVGERAISGGGAISNVAIDVAEVNSSNAGPEVIIAIPGSTPSVRVYSLGGTLLHNVSVPAPGTFFMQPLGVPNGEGPGGAARVLLFPDGGVDTGTQVLSVNLSTSAVTAGTTGEFFGFSGLRAALGAVGMDGEADLMLCPGPGSEPFLRPTNLDYSSAGTVILPFEVNYNSGVSVTTGDTDGGQAPEIITGAGPGAPPLVRVFTNTTPPRLVRQFNAYDPAFRGGVRVAAGDLNGDGIAEIITGPAGDGAPLVRIFSNKGELLNEFLAYTPSFTGGINIAVGDVAGDGAREIVVAPNAPGASVNMAIFRTDGTEVTRFQAASASFDAAVHLAIGDVDGDGKEDIIAGARNSATTTGVRVFRGGTPTSGDMLLNFAPFPAEQTLDARVGFVGNALGATGRTPLILVGEGGPGTTVRVFNSAGSLVDTISTFTSPVASGVNVGSIRLSGELIDSTSEWFVY